MTEQHDPGMDAIERLTQSLAQSIGENAPCPTRQEITTRRARHSHTPAIQLATRQATEKTRHEN